MASNPTDNFIGTVVCAAFNFAPPGFVMCAGGTIPIAQNTALFSIIGTSFGGDGKTTFGVPDLRSRAPRHRTSSNPIGSAAGVEQVQLQAGQLAQHTHPIQATSAAATATTPQGNVLSAGNPRGIAVYAPPGTASGLAEHAIGQTGGASPHTNIQPYLAMNYLLTTTGLYPSPPADNEPFMGEIRIFPWGVIPSGWAQCNGQVLAIGASQALFSLLGTMYGGNGISTFQLPDLRGRVPVGMGQGNGLSPYVQGQMAGSETVTLTTPQMPQHFHQMNGVAGAPTSLTPSGNMLALGAQVFNSGAFDATMDSSSVVVTGQGRGHENMMPFLTLNYCICINGIYPSRS
ncbi:MAG: tail fiber protein [Bryobacteraceae bacterium]